MASVGLPAIPWARIPSAIEVSVVSRFGIPENLSAHRDPPAGPIAKCSGTCETTTRQRVCRKRACSHRPRAACCRRKVSGLTREANSRRDGWFCLLRVRQPAGSLYGAAERLLDPPLGERARLPVWLWPPYVPSPGSVPLAAFGLRVGGAGTRELLDPLWALGRFGETRPRAVDEELGRRFVPWLGARVEVRGNW